MQWLKRVLSCSLFLLPACRAEQILLQVPSGAPLRLYLNSRLTTRVGQPVTATLLDPVYSFDRVVIPAGSLVEGHVTNLLPATRMQRVSAILNGDFTPLAKPEVRFESVHLASGTAVKIETVPALPLNSFFRPVRASRHKGNPAPNHVPDALKRQIQHQLEGQLSSRTSGVSTVVLGPDRLESLQELLVARLPWHPQWVRKGTRFDAELGNPVSFGEGTIPDKVADMANAPIPADTLVHARLLTVLDSHSSKPGDLISAVLTEPLFSSSHQLLLPEGTRLTGSVKISRPARLFHRGGRLRFSFDRLDAPPSGVAQAQSVSSQPVRGQLAAAEGSSGSIDVNTEGEVKATESKARFLGPVLAGIAAARAQDNDERNGTQKENRGGRALGGFSGLGLLGTALAQSSHSAGQALGYWGLAISLYTNVVARGQEVIFEKNHSVDILFNSQRPAVPAAHLTAGTK